jgi:hypothetical protein
MNPLKRADIKSYTREFLRKLDHGGEDENYLSRNDIEYFENLNNANGQFIIDQEDIRLLKRDNHYKSNRAGSPNRGNGAQQKSFVMPYNHEATEPDQCPSKFFLLIKSIRRGPIRHQLYNA